MSGEKFIGGSGTKSEETFIVEQDSTLSNALGASGVGGIRGESKTPLQTALALEKLKRIAQEEAQRGERSIGDRRKPTNPKDIVGIRKWAMSCVPITVVMEIGIAMLEGALKYGRYNWRAMGVRGSVYYDATMRHLTSWWEGEDIDADSQLSHITKAITSLTVLRDAMIQGKFEDDRPPSTKELQAHMAGLNERASKLVDKYAEEKPYHYTIKDEL